VSIGLLVAGMAPGLLIISQDKLYDWALDRLLRKHQLAHCSGTASDLDLGA
jgi:hypothetical protein